MNPAPQGSRADGGSPAGQDAGPDTDAGRRSADESAVRNLVGRAALVADDGTLEEYASVYTDDAVWNLPSAPCRGLAEIVAGARARRAEGTAGPGTGTRHVVTVLEVAVDGDDARATSYWTFYGDTGTAPVPRLVGRYDDRVRRTTAGWRIVRRDITVG